MDSDMDNKPLFTKNELTFYEALAHKSGVGKGVVLGIFIGTMLGMLIGYNNWTM